MSLGAYFRRSSERPPHVMVQKALGLGLRLARRALADPPHVAVAKAAGVALRTMQAHRQQRREERRPSYAIDARTGPLQPRLAPIDTAVLDPDLEALAGTTARFLEHRFDLLGSGWVDVSYGVPAAGLGGYRYDSGPTPDIDPSGRWLAGRISNNNRREAHRLWRLVRPPYRPIDWQRDAKSGWRWDEGRPSRKATYGDRPGVDVKWPWELARMQHLPRLALAHAASSDAAPGFAPPHVYAHEFRNQVLDFLATNPPRFGVNWLCTMDVAIRIANIVLAWDLFRAHRAVFDGAFEAALARAALEHGRHIAEHLEWHDTVRGNHYLANLVGLLFVAAWLPASPDTDTWLSYAGHRLVAEIGRQFERDGGNFEASTSYHAMSGQFVAFSLAVCQGLEPERRACRQADMARLGRMPGWQGDRPALPAAPDWLPPHLRRIAAFSSAATRPDGRVAQIGDNDSGRLFKFAPALRRLMVADARARFRHLTHVAGLPDDATIWDEDLLVQRDLRGAIAGLFGESRTVDATMAASLTRGRFFPSARASGDESDRSFPDFGLVILASARFWMAVRCGPTKQRGHGAHAHNDQLSFELCVDRRPLVVDPGTMVYTPLPELRNRFRSTASHNTLTLAGHEQNAWPPGQKGLFMLPNRAQARIVETASALFVGEHAGYGEVHRRRIEIDDHRVAIMDSCNAAGSRFLSFHLDPDVTVESSDGQVVAATGPTRLRFAASGGRWAIEDGSYSPGYGKHVRCRVLRLSTDATAVGTTIELLT